MYSAGFMTFQIFIVLCLVLKSVQTTFLTDYDTFFNELLENPDDISANRQKRLEYLDEFDPNAIGNSKVENSLLTKLGFDLNSRLTNDERIGPQELRNEHVLMEATNGKGDRKLLGLDDSSPVLSKVLKIIDKLDLPSLKSVQDGISKRNNPTEWNNDPIFRRLMQAAYRLGELEEDAPRVQGRRFHAWGG